MTQFEIETTKTIDFKWLNSLLNSAADHPHIHFVDMPYRFASRWREADCDIGIWKVGGQIVGWALFQSPWWNLDYAILPEFRGDDLEESLLKWGHQQMLDYAERTQDQFWGSVELFEDTPNFEKTAVLLTKLGFKQFDWQMNRYELDLTRPLPPVMLPDGFRIRPFNPLTEIESYVNLQRSVFDSNNMTNLWRERIIQQPNYIPEIDLIVENSEQVPVGFCICWENGDLGQIEPLGVHSDYQGLGIGRALEQTACQHLIKRGIKKSFVDHASFNKKAISLSLKNGFQQINKALRYYLEIP